MNKLCFKSEQNRWEFLISFIFIFYKKLYLNLFDILIHLLLQTVQMRGMIPLHPGSRVCVSKTELVKIFNPKPAVYTVELAKLLFKKELHQKKPTLNGDPIAHLEGERLNSLIS